VRAYIHKCVIILRLQELKDKAVTLQVDATYKLLWQGFPVLVAGCSDQNRVFHPVTIAVCTGETAEDFRFLFESLKQNNPSYCPQAIVADCSDAISKACFDAFDDNVIRIFCWAHVIRNVDKRLFRIKDDKVRGLLRTDVCSLQLARSDEEFNVASGLWMKKWSEHEHSEELSDFLAYFHQEYLVKYKGWHVGRHIGSPCTNNGLEATNNNMKTHHTFETASLCSLS